jgi:Flp pilus assembly protein protease CpaA
MFHPLGLAVYFLAATIISISDLRYRIIRNRDLFLLFATGCAANAPHFSAEDLQSLVYVSFACLALNFAFRGKIGAGDIKLFWVISLWTTSFPKWLEGFTIAWVLGGLFAIAYSGVNWWKGQRKSSIPFAPFIFLGFLPVI